MSGFPPGQAAWIMAQSAGRLAFLLLFLHAVLDLRGHALARPLGLSGLSFALLHPLLSTVARLQREAFPLSRLLREGFLPDPRQGVAAVSLLLGALAFWILLAGQLGPRRLRLLAWPALLLAAWHALRQGGNPVYGVMAVAALFLLAWRLVRGPGCGGPPEGRLAS